MTDSASNLREIAVKIVEYFRDLINNVEIADPGEGGVVIVHFVPEFTLDTASRISRNGVFGCIRGAS